MRLGQSRAMSCIPSHSITKFAKAMPIMKTSHNPPSPLPTYGVLDHPKLTANAKVTGGPTGTLDCNRMTCSGAFHPFVSGVIFGEEKYIDICGYRLLIQSSYNEHTGCVNYLIRCREHILVRLIGKRQGKLKSRINGYIIDIDNLMWERIRLEKKIEEKEGTWRKLTKEEFRGLIVETLPNGRKKFRYSLVAAHFAWYDCGLHNLYFSVVEAYTYGPKGLEECALGEKYFQFYFDCCENTNFGLNIKAEYALGDNFKQVKSYMGLLRLDMARGSQFKKDQVSKNFKSLFPGLADWQKTDENELEWTDDKDEELNDSDED